MKLPIEYTDHVLLDANRNVVGTNDINAAFEELSTALKQMVSVFNAKPGDIEPIVALAVIERARHLLTKYQVPGTKSPLSGLLVNT